MSATIELIDRDRWRTLAPLFRDYSYRQLWDFGVACAERVGATSGHVAVLRGTDVIGLADVRIKRIPLLRAGIAYINGGPLVRRDQDTDAEHLAICLSALSHEYVERQGLVLRIAPPLGLEAWNARQSEVFSSTGFGPTAQVSRYRTLVLDIDRPLEEIRKGFDRKWRNHLNRAERNGLVIRSGTDGGLFAEFCHLYDQMLARKRFNVELDAAFYARVQAELDDSERLVIILVDVEGQPAAGHVFSMLGDTCVSLLGASNEVGMKSEASYLQQWHIIQTAREHGFLAYDLGGIDPEANPGVYEFKQGMSGTDSTAPGPFEFQPCGFRHYLVTGAEQAYRRLGRVAACKRE